jgi:hypothetical protein
VLVVFDPFAVTAPVTENLTVTPTAGFPNASLTVAVTQCCAPTVFVAVAGESVSVAGAAATYVLLAAPAGSPVFCVPLPFVSA